MKNIKEYYIKGQRVLPVWGMDDNIMVEKTSLGSHWSNCSVVPPRWFKHGV